MDVAIAGTDWSEVVGSLYRDDADRLWRAIRTWSDDPEIASESVAEAYAQAIHRGPVLREPAAWIWRAAFRIAAGELKARARSEDLPARTEHLDRYADPDLHAALRRLPDAQRAAVILHYYADLPVDEIARRVGSNRLAVRANLSRGRRRLAKLLGGSHG
jgi:RNA polymerase sigma-70 factor (ECF subfamily)